MCRGEISAPRHIAWSTVAKNTATVRHGEHHPPYDVPGTEEEASEPLRSAIGDNSEAAAPGAWCVCARGWRPSSARSSASSRRRLSLSARSRASRCVCVCVLGGAGGWVEGGGGVGPTTCQGTSCVTADVSPGLILMHLARLAYCTWNTHHDHDETSEMDVPTIS